MWNDLIGWTGDPHLSPFHLASYVSIGGGFWPVAAAWGVLHEAQWPTIPTVIMFPILVLVYTRRASAEERESAAAKSLRHWPRHPPRKGPYGGAERHGNADMTAESRTKS